MEKFPSPFRVTLEVEWERDSESVHRAASWQNLPYPKTTPLTCFSTRTEEQEVLKLIGEVIVHLCIQVCSFYQIDVVCLSI